LVAVLYGYENKRLHEFIYTPSDRPLFPDIISNGDGKKLEQLAYRIFGSPPAGHPQLSFSEVVRALAQHYDFPTLFIDVSFHPLVGAFFATHSYSRKEKRWEVSSKPGVVFRWPAHRFSSSRLEISGTSNGEARNIKVIDITKIHPHMRRPRHQFAGLVTPVSDPKPLYQPFSSPISMLDLCDMATLDCCDRFELSVEAGSTLEKLEGLTPDALFPDCVDLGYSYVSVIAFLSLVAHKGDSFKEMPRSWIPQSWVDSGIKSYSRAILAGRALLDRECLRLLPDALVTDLIHQYSLSRIDMILGKQLEAAVKAVEQMCSGEGEVANFHQKLITFKEEQIKERVQFLYSNYLKIMAEVLPEAAELLSKQGSPQVRVRSGNCDWILKEMDRRVSLLDAVINWANCVPAFALLEPDRYGRYLETMVRDPNYECQVQQAIESCKKWLGENPVFVKP
jgi:hypothetical protein